MPLADLGEGAQINLDETDAFIPCGRMEAECRFRRRVPKRWKLPTLPLTEEAHRRDWVDPRIGNSLFLRAELVVTRCVVDETFYKVDGHYVEIDDEPLDPGSIRGRFSVDREELLARAGLCTSGRILRIGGGVHIACMQVNGHLQHNGIRYALSSRNLAFGFGILLEASPACPPIRGYLDLRAECGWGYGNRSMVSSNTAIAEFGVKLKFCGCMGFAGYRFETHSMYWDEGPELRLRLRGPVLGAGLAF